MSISAKSEKTDQFQCIRSAIDELARVQPHGIYLIDPETGSLTTFADLQTQVRTVASYIQQQGIQRGDTVAFAASNSPDTAIVILGIFYGGYLATAINLVAGSSVISYVLEHSETKLVFANPAGMDAIEPSLNDVKGISIRSIDAELFETKAQDVDLHDTSETGGLLMYTSGTTGRPKGVVLSQQNLLAGGENTALAHGLKSVDRGMCVLPLYHINGLCVTVMGALVSGGSLVMPPKFSVSTFWKTIVAQSCTWFSVVPTHISYLLHENSKPVSQTELSCLRFGRSASAPLSPDIQSAFEKKFGIPIIETMGLTETAAQILSNPLPPGTRKIGSPGIAYGNEVSICDENQTERPRDVEGEVLIRGPNVMQYYLKNEKATSQAITRDGWLRTGDLGRMDSDGYVYITGRLKELIIKGGENIAPREIDEALYSHEDVVEAAAFACKCSQYGERVEAAVMVSEGSKVTEDILAALCKSKLGTFKSPDRIHFLPELPKGPSGKIQRLKLVEIFDL
jgi:acyl-CoA synthetase (AMP-forming)/AMP-acid ligase II